MSEHPIPEDLKQDCSNCSGKGFVDALSFSDPAQVIQKTCRPCSGKGWLWSLTQEEMAERIARLESENTYRGSLLELALVYLEDCDAWQLRESITKELARAALAEKGLI